MIRISRYRLLKTFINGEQIKLSIDGEKHKYIFVRVSNTHLTIKDGTEQKEIELERITSVTL